MRRWHAAPAVLLIGMLICAMDVPGPANGAGDKADCRLSFERSDLRLGGDDAVLFLSRTPMSLEKKFESYRAARQAFRRYFDDERHCVLIVDPSVPEAALKVQDGTVRPHVRWPLAAPQTPGSTEVAAADRTALLSDDPAVARLAVRARLVNGLGPLAAHVAEEEMDALVDQAWQRLLAARGAATGRGTSGGIAQAGSTDMLRHEIGHALFIATVWPETVGASYGGTAPDWLDEVAAVLVESEGDTRRRQQLFLESVRGGAVMDLRAYLSMPHPLSGAQAVGSRSGLSVSVRIVDDAADDPISLFYAQTRGFIDYLLARTGNERVFLEIAGHLKVGGTMAGWLKTGETPQKSGLPPTIAALDADFRAFSHEVAGLPASD